LFTYPANFSGPSLYTEFMYRRPKISFLVPSGLAGESEVEPLTGSITSRETINLLMHPTAASGPLELGIYTGHLHLNDAEALQETLYALYRLALDPAWLIDVLNV